MKGFPTWILKTAYGRFTQQKCPVDRLSTQHKSIRKRMVTEGTIYYGHRIQRIPAVSDLKFFFCRLAFMVPKDAMQAFKGRKQSTVLRN